MAASVAERKVWYLGSWKNDVIADNVIRQISSLVRDKKGVKVKVQLAGDGLRVVRSNFVQGKTLTDFVAIQNLYYMTVNQHYPECLLVIAKDTTHKYQILAFRCASGLDAGFLIQSLQTIRKRFRPGEGYNFEFTQKEGGNWTLRSKPAGQNKRQLSTIVDMHPDGKTVTHQNGVVTAPRKYEKRSASVAHTQQKINESNTKNYEVHVARAQNSPPVVREKVFREEVYSKGKTQHNIGIQAATTENFADNVSEVSDTSQAFQHELNYLSNELREIKFMLEKSTGISAEEYHDKEGKPREEPSVESQVNDALRPIDAVVITDDEGDSPVTNGHFFRQQSLNSEDGEVRVAVPDYRSFGVQTTKYSATKSSTLPANSQTQTSDQPELLRATTATTYEAWKDEVVLRNKPGRSQRPRTAVYHSNSLRSSVSGSVRGSVRGVPNDQVHFVTVYGDSHKGSMPNQQRFSTSVRRPIEKVYVRPNGSIKYRPHSVHIVPAKPIYTSVPQVLDMNQNKINGSVINSEIQTNGHSSNPSTPRGVIIRS